MFRVTHNVSAHTMIPVNAFNQQIHYYNGLVVDFMKHDKSVEDICKYATDIFMISGKFMKKRGKCNPSDYTIRRHDGIAEVELKIRRRYINHLGSTCDHFLFTTVQAEISGIMNEIANNAVIKCLTSPNLISSFANPINRDLILHHMRQRLHCSINTQDKTIRFIVQLT